jgi:ribosomal protein S18 acetylase RimI-like enzyme
MSEIEVRRFVEPDRAAVIGLWERCGLTRPWNDPGLDIDRKLAHDGILLVAVAVAVATADPDRADQASATIVGTVMAGYDGHRGWVNYLAVEPTHRRGGIGARLMDAAEHHLRLLGCPKINLQIRDDNLAAVAFYESLGFGRDAVLSMGKRLVDDTTVATDDPTPLDTSAVLVELETAMWRPATRGDRAWTDARLAPDFREHGRSGHRYGRAECLDLPIGSIDIELPLRDVQVTPLGDRCVLVTYRTVEGRGPANRSSIWRSTPTGWQLVFHQGTPV